MGTRNLIAVVQDDTVKIAQYGQYDGYFSGQGESVVNFIRDNLEKYDTSLQFRKNVRGCTFLQDGDPIPELQQFDRRTSADILDLVLENPLVLKDAFEFGKDSCLCEFAYVINLDNNELEVYTGFNKNPLTDDLQRWGNEPYEPDLRYNTYYPVKLYEVVKFSTIFNKDYNLKSKCEKLSDLIDDIKCQLNDAYPELNELISNKTEELLESIYHELGLSDDD